MEGKPAQALRAAEAVHHPWKQCRPADPALSGGQGPMLGACCGTHGCLGVLCICFLLALLLLLFVSGFGGLNDVPLNQLGKQKGAQRL